MKRIFLIAVALVTLSQHAAAAGVSISLDKLSSSPGLNLVCAEAKQSLDIPVPDRWSLTRVTVDVHYTSSMGLVTDESQMVFLINDTPFALTHLDSASPDVRIKLNVPVEYMRGGYNRLTFQAIQTTKTKGCEAPCSPDKFTHINLMDSSLHMEYEEKSVPLGLSSIAGFLFDPKVFPEARVNLILQDQSPASMTQAGIVSSGIARRFDYRKVMFSVTDAPQPGMDNVVIGSREFVGGLLQKNGMALGEVKGGFLKIFPLPMADTVPDPAHALIVVTGGKPDHVRLAAETFANLSISFPGSQEMDTYSLSIPDIPAYAGREVLEADKTYDFKTLNFPTATFQGINPWAKPISFRLPADFLIQQNLSAKMILNFAYGAGARADSALNIVVNGKAVRAIRLSDEDGGYFDNYQVDIPTFLFRPGQNEITFGIELHPAADSCPLMVGNLFLTMFETSMLTFPGMPHFVEMPKLELFMLNGFPFTRWPDGHDALVYIPEPSRHALASAFNLIGLITQRNGFPLVSLELTDKLPTGWQGDILMVGNPRQVPAAMQAKSPLNVGTKADISYPIIRDWENAYTFAHVNQTGTLGPQQGLLLQFESPYQTGRSVMLVGAEEPPLLYLLSQALLDPEVQGQVRGGITLVDLGAEYDKTRVTSLRSDHSYTTGKGEDISALESFLYTHPMAYYALLFLVTAALAWALYHVLLRYRMSRKLGRDANKAR